MSSPLSTLKKLKRTPLQQGEKTNIPPRRNLFSEFQAAAAENGSSISDQRPVVASTIPVNTGISQEKDSPDVLCLKQKLCCLEERVKAQAEEILSKDKRIAALEEALRVKNERCMMLQRQVFEMESFLMDYNMIWVGSDNTDAEESRQTDNSNKLWTPPENLWSCVNFDLLLDKIQELNILAGEDETYIQTTTTGAVLAHKKPIELWLYKNGFMISDGPFRTYQEQKTQQFLQDIMDGYFPSELQERFPDGVPFEVHDRRDEQFVPEPQRQTFPGVGRVIRGDNGKAETFSNAVPGGKKHGVITMGQRRNHEEVPEAAPQVSRRREQGSSNTQSSYSEILVDSPALQATKHSLQGRSGCPVPHGDVTTLKIRSEDGSSVFILKISFSETIGQIRHYLDKHRGGSWPSYDIISLHPLCRYEDDRQTIQACGLTANTALLLRTRPVGNQWVAQSDQAASVYK